MLLYYLKGNHEAMFLEWIDDFSGSDKFQLEALAIDSWLKTDSEQRFNTFRTFITREELEEYETESQVFVHAGIDEEAGEYWMWGSGDEVFLWKFPASRGGFIKTIVAGHVGTGDIAGDKHFHDIYHDGKSHYYIDGSVYKHGKLILMCYDEEENKYYELKNGKKERFLKLLVSSVEKKVQRLSGCSRLSIRRRTSMSADIIQSIMIR